MIRRWLQARRERKRQAEFERGFGWAMTRYYLHKEPVFYLFDSVAAGSAFDPTPFDEGATAALDMIHDPQKAWISQQ